jgi:hypothetical protein
MTFLVKCIFLCMSSECLQKTLHVRHYRNPALCRVSSGLSNVFFLALGKEALLRVLKKTLGKKNIRQRPSLSSVKKLGK